LSVKVRRTDRNQNSFERKNDTAAAPGAAQTIRGPLLAWKPKIGSVTEKMKPVAEKTQSAAGAKGVTARSYRITRGLPGRARVRRRTIATDSPFGIVVAV
jgi:hypothetical protein